MADVAQKGGWYMYWQVICLLTEHLMDHKQHSEWGAFHFSIYLNLLRFECVEVQLSMGQEWPAQDLFFWGRHPSWSWYAAFHHHLPVLFWWFVSATQECSHSPSAFSMHTDCIFWRSCWISVWTWRKHKNNNEKKIMNIYWSAIFDNGMDSRTDMNSISLWKEGGWYIFQSSKK